MPHALEKDHIRFLLPGNTHCEKKYLLIENYIPMLISFNIKRNICALTDKEEHFSTITFQKLLFKLLLIYKDSHTHYEGPSTGSFLFTTVELARIHETLDHTSAFALVSALKRSYPIETESSDFTKLQEIKNSWKESHLYG